MDLLEGSLCVQEPISCLHADNPFVNSVNDSLITQASTQLYDYEPLPSTQAQTCDFSGHGVSKGERTSFPSGSRQV